MNRNRGHGAVLIPTAEAEFEFGHTAVYSDLIPATVMALNELSEIVVTAVNATVAETPVAALMFLDRTTEGLVRRALNIAGNATLATVSMGAVAEKVEIVTVVAAAAAAAFLSCRKTQETSPAATFIAGVQVSTRLEPDRVAAPAVEMPVQVREDVGEADMSKFTPATVIALIEPTVTVVKERVAVTPVAALTLLERTSEAAARAALDIGG